MKSRISAYGVHLFTALGAALGLWALILIFDGYFQEALYLLAAAAIVDSVDGALARLADTKKFGARIDGALMDNIIDFLNWTIIPLLWIYATMHLPIWVLLICAIASIFGFTNTQAKTEDHFFLGFPSYWNIVVLYIYLLHLSGGLASAILLFFAAVTFLPVKFIYPSRTKFLRPLTTFLGIVYVLQLLALLYYFDAAAPLLVYSSFAFPFYYFGLSFYVNWRPSVTSP